MNRIVPVPDAFYREVIEITHESHAYNDPRNYRERYWKVPKRGEAAWIEELADDPKKMVTAHGVGGEKAVCDFLGIPYHYGLGEYRSYDYTLLDMRLGDNKNTFDCWGTLNVNVEAHQKHIDFDRILPDLYSLTIGMLTTQYHVIGFIHREAIINHVHFVPGWKNPKTKKWHPAHYRAKQGELWWLDKEPVLLIQAEMFA